MSRVSPMNLNEDKGSQWSQRKPTFWKTFRSLLRRSLLMKIRDWSSVVAEIISLLIIISMVLFSKMGNSPNEEIKNPSVQTKDQMFGSTLVQYMRVYTLGDGGNFVAAPNKDETKKMIKDFWSNKTIPVYDTKAGKVSEMVNLSERFEYLSTLDDFPDNIQSTEKSSIGIFLANSGEEGYYRNITANVASNNEQANMFTSMTDMVAGFSYAMTGESLAEAFTAVNAKLQAYIDSLPADQAELKQNLTNELLSVSAEGYSSPNINGLVMSRPETTTSLPLNLSLIHI